MAAMEKAFRALQQKWYKKLAKGGFVDIEEHKYGVIYLKRWDSQYFMLRHTPASFQAKEKYYEMVCEFHATYQFDSPQEKQIWSEHAEGTPIREIAQIIKRPSSFVFQTLKRLKAAMRFSLYLGHSGDHELE